MLAYIKAVSKESVDGKDVTSKEADMKKAEEAKKKLEAAGAKVELK